MSIQIQSEPLVSVCIITYNSQDYILEALDSVANQTYRNLELIISDDCSHDKTVEICRQWLASNYKRFMNSEIVTIEKNTGVSANCNRAVKRCKGQWVKYFAGDDKLLPNCIVDNINFIKEHPSTDVLFSDMVVIGDYISEKIIDSRHIYFEKLTKGEFKRRLLYQNFLPAPSSFYSKVVFDKVGGYDENIPFMEDKPFFLRAVLDNRILSYMKKTTICYRKHSNSLSNIKDANPKYLESCKQLNDWVLQSIQRNYPALWLYMRNMDMYNSNPTKWNYMCHLLRFINPAYYIHVYIDYKIRFFCHFSK